MTHKEKLDELRKTCNQLSNAHRACRFSASQQILAATAGDVREEARALAARMKDAGECPEDAQAIADGCSELQAKCNSSVISSSKAA